MRGYSLLAEPNGGIGQIERAGMVARKGRRIEGRGDREKGINQKRIWAHLLYFPPNFRAAFAWQIMEGMRDKQIGCACGKKAEFGFGKGSIGNWAFIN
jgi:hypothetical protein